MRFSLPRSGLNLHKTLEHSTCFSTSVQWRAGGQRQLPSVAPPFQLRSPSPTSRLLPAPLVYFIKDHGLSAASEASCDSQGVPVGSDSSAVQD